MHRLLQLALFVLLLASGVARAATVTPATTNDFPWMSPGPRFTTGIVPGIGDPGLSLLTSLNFALDAPSKVEWRADVLEARSPGLVAPPDFSVEYPDPDMLIARAVLSRGTSLDAMSGEVRGTASGTYSFMATAIAASPEPQTWMLVLASIACFGVVIARCR